MKSKIFTDLAPQAIGPYSQAIKHGNVVYLSGQIPLVPETMQLVSEDFKTQALQVFQNLKAICNAAGGDLDDIIKLTILMMNLNDFSALNEIMKSFFKDPYPARMTYQVAGLPKGALLEIDAIMLVRKD